MKALRVTLIDKKGNYKDFILDKSLYTLTTKKTIREKNILLTQDSTFKGLDISQEKLNEIVEFQDNNKSYNKIVIKETEVNEIDGLLIAKEKSRLTPKRKKELIFIIVLLAFPLLQFFLTWIFVNSYSIIVAFQNVTLEGETSFAGFDNFKTVIKELFDSTIKPVVITENLTISSGLLVLLNSLAYGFITIFISLPLALISSYFLSRKMPLANFFRIIFFLPNIISVVALVYAFKTQISTDTGVIAQLVEALGGSINTNTWPHTTIIVLIYCIWAGLGYNVLLMSGAIGRIPKELFESARMDGAGNFQEFTKIMIPMIWPTIVTLIVLGMTSILTLYLQPVLFDLSRTETIAGSIFIGVKEGSTHYPEYSSFGLFYSFIFAPLVLLVRHFASKKYSNVDM